MLQYDRNTEPAPASLSDQRSRKFREALIKIFQSDVKSTEQRRVNMRQYYVDDGDLRISLAQLFNHRCAFCETPREVAPYRFRPSEEAGPSDAAPKADANRSHLYYTWLTNSWQNLYTICPGCQPVEPSIFPVRGKRCPLPDLDDIEVYAASPTGSWRDPIKERPVFLDPCGSDDLRKHLAALPSGTLIAMSDRGLATIQHFKLDRPKLVEERRQAYSHYIEWLLGEPADEYPFGFDQLEYGGSWYLLLYQIARKLGGGTGGYLSLHRIERYYMERLERSDFRRRFEQAIEDLINNPGQVAAKLKFERPLPGDSRPAAFEISNFKSIEKLQFTMPKEGERVSAETGELLAPALVIIGENAAGKSSILEAMTLALSPKAVRDDLTPDFDQYMLDPRLLGSKRDDERRPAEIRVTYENEQSAALQVDWAGLFDMYPPPDARIPVFAYGAFRLFLKTGKRTVPSSNIRTLFDPSYVLPNPESWLKSLQGKAIFSEVIRVIRSVLAVDQQFDVIEIDPATRECLLVTKTERPGMDPIVVRTPLRAVSSGFRSVLSMICDVLRGLIDIQGPNSATLTRARAVILIDEVEAHLHPRWKMRIMQGLREALPNATFIVTTHDPLCLRGLSGSEVMVLRRVQRRDDNGDELPEYVEQLERLPAIGTLTIEQLLTSDLFQLFSTDSPETETSLARVGDLLGRQLAGEKLDDIDAKRLASIRVELRTQIKRSMPIGSTDVERLIQEAVEFYLVERRKTRATDLAKLRADARSTIIDALRQL